MTNVDQFESVFRSADKTVFAYKPIAIESVVVITDLEGYDAELVAEGGKQLLQGFSAEWRVVPGSSFSTVRELLDVVEEHRADLVCTYRHLHTEGWRWPFTLGDHLEVLTQATTTPVLVLPHPKAGKAADHALKDTSSVMAITDHLTGDDHLVNFAVRFTQPGGTLRLAHIEDERAYQRMIEVISKLPELDTDVAREAILKQLLKEPTDYVESCRAALEQQGIEVAIEPLVSLGHHLEAYSKLIAEHEVDLLLMNTKDEDQMAMHGLAYPLAVELRSIPLLML